MSSLTVRSAASDALHDCVIVAVLYYLLPSNCTKVAVPQGEFLYACTKHVFIDRALNRTSMSRDYFANRRKYT
jgi:hypothetical protein